MSRIDGFMIFKALRSTKHIIRLRFLASKDMNHSIFPKDIDTYDRLYIFTF